MPRLASTTARGYGYAHQQLRAWWAKELKRVGVLPCARCGGDIHHGDKWDLGHTDDRTAYTGPEHRTCNRRDGGKRRHQARVPRRRVL